MSALRFLKTLALLAAVYGPGWFLVSYSHDAWVQDDDVRCYAQELKRRTRTSDPDARQRCHLTGDATVQTTTRLWRAENAPLLQESIPDAIREGFTLEGLRWLLLAIPSFFFFVAGWMRWGPFANI